ncbi:hypothetical protein CTEN210_15614 [Chaetoceros tenuissimus]|uniref:Uncharacterized protein n=1 Tax=Chaetoceros tenuissimus TaxID=426638 RepID=A0AAD3D791_9STRA|nr:hypothetical protein CTEN210_15614 [Chaetoceros tenuissimus]
MGLQSLDSCGNGCGLIAAFVGMIGFGSFGAPLKCKAIDMCSPDPFVLQTYKSIMCFVTSWVVLFLGVDFEYTNWGIVSGILWVSGGVCGIFGIRNAGLAVSVGTWSCITVLISFSWGIFFFDEQVNSIWSTAFGVMMLVLGFIGMAYFSSGSNSGSSDAIGSEQTLELSTDLNEPLLNADSEDIENGDQHSSNTATNNENEQTQDGQTLENASRKQDDENTIIFLGIKWERRLLGLIGAACDGLLGGSNLIPMKLAPKIDRGIDYVISFGVGAAIATLLGWLLYFLVNSYKTKSFHDGYKALPSLHVDKILLPGVLSGTLWSIGNVSQILSVTFLGESIGMSIVQSQMIVSGLLGIILFHEIKGKKDIACWVLSAVVTFMGIVLLSKEHKS